MEKDILLNFKCILTLLAYCKLHANLSQTKEKMLPYHRAINDLFYAETQHTGSQFRNNVISQLGFRENKVMFSAAKGLSYYK